SYAGARMDRDNLALLQLRDRNEFRNRESLLRTMDAFRRGVDGLPVDRMQANYRQAYEVLASSRMVEAMDLSREPLASRQRYGTGRRRPAHPLPRHPGDRLPQPGDRSPRDDPRSTRPPHARLAAGESAGGGIERLTASVEA